MTKKNNKIDLKKIKKYLPYFLISLATILIVVLGSFDKRSAEMNISLDTLAESNYKMSVDQLSELYVVADLSDALRLASATDVASNYVIANTMYDAGQTSAGKIEKPNITDLPVTRGIIEYTVAEGEDADTIAAKFGLTADQVRWSNGLKNVNVGAGTVLYLPSRPGIIYTVKSDDTIESIVSKYGSSSAEIIALNDLEVSGISEGMKIVIKDGTLPETERPEYVAPVIRYTYTFLGNTSVRTNMTSLGYNCGLPNNGYGIGQCTNWAWYKRQDLPGSLGHAATWAANASAMGYTVSWAPNSVPVAGAIFQNGGGWFGHVGYVEAVNSDGSILISEMNYNYQPCHIIQSIVPASMVGIFNYIYP